MGVMDILDYFILIQIFALTFLTFHQEGIAPSKSFLNLSIRFSRLLLFFFIFSADFFSCDAIPFEMQRAWSPERQNIQQFLSCSMDFVQSDICLRNGSLD